MLGFLPLKLFLEGKKSLRQILEFTGQLIKDILFGFVKPPQPAVSGLSHLLVIADMDKLFLDSGAEKTAQIQAKVPYFF